ncbi:hypothetical protein KFE25_004873 [Diacronema lutheri]|uniref:Uncharacterized protein n=1 Tax=Diacronema lutheri TaxID=2081491 RepID=A0A8J5XGA8_DIALT|nr:hypothetical protein KFE25_004873 [Diacronema lutheri]
MLGRAAAVGPRARVRPARRRWGPFALLCAAAPLILADIVRHVLQDVGVWPGCGDGAIFSRANSSDPFPSSCLWSSSQYRCEVVCCVPTWLPVPAAPNGSRPAVEFGWFPPQTSRWPDAREGFQFGTLRPDGSLYLPAHFERARAREPFAVFSAPLALFADGTRRARARHEPECVHGTNDETGACLLVDSSLPYEEQLARLPLRDPAAPYDARTNPRECSCERCTHAEDVTHLSPMGLAVTLCATYVGFALLATAVLWNANIGAQLRKVRAEWRVLRAAAAAAVPPAERA